MTKTEFEKYSKHILDYANSNYSRLFREPGGQINHKFLVPGACYDQELWDWDSWLINLAIGAITDEDISEYEKGCVLNFLEHVREDGWTPIMITAEKCMPPFDDSDIIPGHQSNTHKPCLAMHARYIIEKNGDVSWLENNYENLERYINFYFENMYHKETGLYFFFDDCAVGVDNDPSIFYRPFNSSGSIYLNCLMYQELLAFVYIAEKLDKDATKYMEKAESLLEAVRTHCYDERDGFYYSVDLNLLPINPNGFLHSNAPRHWHCLIQRIDCWSGFMALWAGIATKEQAERILERYLDSRTFHAPYGVRTLSKLEKMYVVKPSCNPSCWLGPIWGIANYMTFKGLLAYGFEKEARELCEKTILLFGQDIEKNGAMHEYYDPETGEGVINKGFQCWNLLAVDMIKWYESMVLE